MKKDKSEINYGKTLFVIAMLLCIGTICVLVFEMTSPHNSSASAAKNMTNNSAVLPIENINSSAQPPSTEEPSRITQAKAMLQAYNDPTFIRYGL